MKSVEEARVALAARLANRKHLLPLIVTPHDGPWPWKLTLGSPDMIQLQQHWESFRTLSQEWHRVALPAGAQLHSTPRRVHGITQRIPTGVEFRHLEAAAEFAGAATMRRIAAAQHRWRRLSATFPDTATEAILGRILDWSEVDIAIMLDAADWFASHDGSGLTLRQVPVAGMHTKWLSHARAQLVAALAGRIDQHGNPTLHLRPRLSPAVHFHYLDPHHLASGRRTHDSWIPGDTAPDTPYPPRLVVICENKDTAVVLDPMPGLVSVEGAGYTGAPAVAALPFVSSAQRVVYWGDIDIDGYMILDRYRSKLPVDSILMDLATYRRFRDFGGDDRHGSTARKLDRLQPPEAEVYAILSDPAWDGPRRIEQERIPIIAATEQLGPSSDDGQLTSHSEY